MSVSAESPLDGFQEVGQFTLQQEPRDQAFPIGRRARFVRLRILENFGGRYTSLGEVKLLEGAAPDYESVLRETPEATAISPGPAPSRPIDETGVALETEPNGTPAEANLLELGRRTKGVIDPLGEDDYFRLALPGTDPAVLTLELLGQPNIRTSLTLFDAVGKSLKRFDPGAVPAQQATFSWTVEPGEHVLQVTEPPISMVLIWDTSGSMQGSTEDLQTGGGDLPRPGASQREAEADPVLAPGDRGAPARVHQRPGAAESRNGWKVLRRRRDAVL